MNPIGAAGDKLGPSTGSVESSPDRPAGSRTPTRGPRLPRLLALVLVLTTTTCVTTERLLESRGSGEVRCYQGELELIWWVVERAIVRNGLRIVEADSVERVVVARTADPGREEDPQQMALDSDAGERIGIFIDSAAPDIWAVEVVSRRYFALDPTAKDWTQDLFRTVEGMLPDSAARPWHYDFPLCLPDALEPDSAGAGARAHEAPAGPPRALERLRKPSQSSSRRSNSRVSSSSSSSSSTT